jgi:arylsulfatase A-like enzyme
MNRPNIVFIVADDFGWADIGTNNPDCFYDTPNLDRLAGAGMNFVNGYAANPVCSPTRFSILTGKYPTREQATEWFGGTRAGRFEPAICQHRMPLEEFTLAEALKQRGYRTAFVGKWHLGDTEEFWPERQGFDVNIGGWESGSPLGGYFAPFENPRLHEYPHGTHLPKALTDESLQVLEQFKDGPFLLYLAYYSVHKPLEGRSDLVTKYEARRERVLTDGKPEFVPEEQVWPVDEERRVRVRQAHAVYGAMVEAMDEQIGRVLDKLDELALSRNTILVFLSDNGGLTTAEGSPTANLPLRAGKGWVYEGGIRVPFVICWPGVTERGSRCDVPVISMDLYPTLLEIADMSLRPEQHLDGVSLVPLLKGRTELHRNSLFWHYPHYSNQGGFPGGAIRMGDWKLVERYEDGHVEMYRLADDPGERRDLSEQETERVAEMRATLHAWYRDVNARFLRAKENDLEPWRPFPRLEPLAPFPSRGGTSP